MSLETVSRRDHANVTAAGVVNAPVTRVISPPLELGLRRSEEGATDPHLSVR